MANKSVKFYRGNLAAYNQNTHADGIYFASDAGCLLMNGKSYSGITDVEFKDGKLMASYIDTNGAIQKKEIELGTGKYAPADTTASTAAIGGIAAGTTAESLNGKSINEVLDMLLYPEYAPEWTDASLTITNSFPLREVGDLCPTSEEITLSGSPAKAQSGTHTATGGNPDGNPVLSLDEGNTWNGVVDSARTVTITASRTYAQGTTYVQTNKGTDTNKTADDSTTLLSNANANPNIISVGNAGKTQYVIKPMTKTTTKKITYVYPIYVGSGEELTKLTLSTSNAPEFTLKPGVPTVAVPSVFKNVKFEQESLGQWFAEAVIGEPTIITKPMKGAPDRNIEYKQYKLKTITEEFKYRVIYS